MAHEHEVIDRDLHFEIDPETREIRSEDGGLTVAQFDHKSERATFTLPRIIEGHDMSLCNSVEVHFINIETDTEKNNKGVDLITDLAADSTDTEKVTCSWLIPINATRLVGKIHFIIRFACINGGTVEYAWDTAICDEITVIEGINNSSEIVEQYPDVLAQWKNEIDSKRLISLIQTVRGDLDGGENVWQATFANGEKYNFYVKNGSKGADGKDGYTPQKGVDYFDGEDGYTPQKGIDYVDGVDGTDGITPHIGDNGNWFIGDTDTGVASSSPDCLKSTGGVMTGVLKAQANTDYAVSQVRNFILVPDGTEVTVTEADNGTIIGYYK